MKLSCIAASRYASPASPVTNSLILNTSLGHTAAWFHCTCWNWVSLASFSRPKASWCWRLLEKNGGNLRNCNIYRKSKQSEYEVSDHSSFLVTNVFNKYADPVLDKLDLHHVVAHRLFRESCFSHKGNYVKVCIIRQNFFASWPWFLMPQDLSQLGRPIADTIILDNSPASYIFHPNNAVPVSSWFNDPHDAELTDLIPFLADLTSVPDVRGILDGARWHNWGRPSHFYKRTWQFFQS